MALTWTPKQIEIAGQLAKGLSQYELAKQCGIALTGFKLFDPPIFSKNGPKTTHNLNDTKILSGPLGEIHAELTNRDDLQSKKLESMDG
jgi:hypothetical protein